MPDLITTWPARRYPHFTPAEFGGPVSPDLLRALERLRDLCGDRPLLIVSGTRSAAENAAVGGAKQSQHLYGRAADIPASYATVAQAADAGFTGIGSKGPWAIHVDVRSGPPARSAY